MWQVTVKNLNEDEYQKIIRVLKSNGFSNKPIDAQHVPDEHGSLQQYLKETKNEIG